MTPLMHPSLAACPSLTGQFLGRAIGNAIRKSPDQVNWRHNSYDQRRRPVVWHHHIVGLIEVVDEYR